MDAPELYESLVLEVQSETHNKINMGGLLYTLKENDEWRKAIGDGVDTWDDFLKQPEIGISRLEADRLMKVYKKFFVDNAYDKDSLSSISLKNLIRLSEIRDVTDEIIDQARTLTDKDFKEVLAENDDIKERTYTYMVMRKCKETGNMTKVHDITSDEIKDKFNINE
jgi:hypothetical protein